MNLEKKLKSLDAAKTCIMNSINELHEAGKFYDEVFPEDKQNRFYNIRWQLEQQREKIKIKEKELRNANAIEAKEEKAE